MPHVKVHKFGATPIKSINKCCFFFAETENVVELPQNQISKSKKKKSRKRKLIQCPHCDFKSEKKMAVKRHIITHTGEKYYKCDTCEYKSTHRHRLTRHLRTHSGDKPFACTLCSYRCSVKGKLPLHMRIHTGEKPYQCPYCPYKSTNSTAIKVHLPIHTGERSFACTDCEFTCSNKSGLIKHMHVMHSLTNPKIPKVKWTVEEKKIILFCFYCAKLEKWGRKDDMFKERLEKSTLPPEKLRKTNIHKLNSIVSQIREYISQEEIDNIKKEAIMEVEKSFDDLSEKKYRKKEKGFWSKDEKWTLVWAMHYAQMKYNKRNYSTVEWQRIFFHHCPEKKDYGNNKILVQRQNFLNYEVFTPEQIQRMKECVEKMIKEEICPIQHPVPLVENYYTALDFSPSSLFNSNDIADCSRKVRKRGTWSKAEKWTAIWAVHYAQTKYKKRSNSTVEWQRIFFHHCPKKKDYGNNKILAQRFNFLYKHAFTSKQIQLMKECVEKMINEEICPIQHPVPLVEEDFTT